MSWGTCNNNKYNDFHPIMSDGRNYSNWETSASISNNIKKNNNIKSNWEYRNYLVNNADNIIKQNQEEACGECCSNNNKKESNNKENNSPYIYSSCSDKAKPYGYETSDLKNMYVSRQDLQSKYITPVIKL